jgi:hypothetical protein
VPNAATLLTKVHALEAHGSDREREEEEEKKKKEEEKKFKEFFSQINITRTCVM